MIVVVWRQIQATFLARFDRFEKLVGDCYSNEKLTTTHEEIVELFTQILPAAAAGGGAGGTAPAAAKNYVSHDKQADWKICVVRCRMLTRCRFLLLCPSLVSRSMRAAAAVWPAERLLDPLFDLALFDKRIVSCSIHSCLALGFEALPVLRFELSKHYGWRSCACDILHRSSGFCDQ
jgi:hypothetical protein